MAETNNFIFGDRKHCCTGNSNLINVSFYIYFIIIDDGHHHDDSTMETVPDAVFAKNRLDKCRRSEEHTSELQSRFDLVCRLLLEKKNGEALQDFDVERDE